MLDSLLNSYHKLKHAQADRLKIDLTIDNLLHMRLADNGIGYNAEAIDRLEGLGRKGIASRVKYLGGNLHDLTKVGQGCRLEIEVPITAQVS